MSHKIIIFMIMTVLFSLVKLQLEVIHNLHVAYMYVRYFSVDQSLKMLALTGDGIAKVNKSLAK